MEKTDFERDDVLMAFLCDYIDGNLGEAGKKSFESYLQKHPVERKFAKKVMAGKKALSRYNKKIKAREGFEARLALRIATEKEKQNSYTH